jgi:L-serine deaminase
MNRLAVWVARRVVGATAPMGLAQATASPLPEIAAGAALDADIAAPPVAMDVMPGLEGRARGALLQRAKIQRGKIQRTKSASASDALTVHPVTAANDSRIHDTNGSVPVPTRARHR